jgi:hypothetical protein
MKPSDVPPVNLFMGILYGDTQILEKAIMLLNHQYGTLDYRSDAWPFDVTDYYEDEMGSPLFRIFISFEKLIPPNAIARIKIENTLSVNGKRTVNLDCGYLDYDKVVLASAKYNGQKVYLDFGIWADLTYHYERGKLFPYPWSFPDFKSGRYDAVFLTMRRLYKNKRKRNAVR